MGNSSSDTTDAGPVNPVLNDQEVSINIDDSRAESEIENSIAENEKKIVTVSEKCENEEGQIQTRDFTLISISSEVNYLEGNPISPTFVTENDAGPDHH